VLNEIEAVTCCYSQHRDVSNSLLRLELIDASGDGPADDADGGSKMSRYRDTINTETK